MSFDPQNPRGTAHPATTPSTPLTSSKQPSYIPPQPVKPGPSRALIAAVAVIALLLVGIVVLLVLNMLKGSPSASPFPATSAPAASHGAPTPAPSPNSSSVPASTGVTTAPPTSSLPSAPPTVPGSIAPPSAGSPEALLLNHVPEAFRATCTAGINTDTAFVALVNCVPNATVTVTYTQYADATGMDAAYESSFAEQQIDRDSGSCEDHATWPAESSYDIAGQPIGRRLCVDTDGTATIYWTDDRLLILSTANSASADADALLVFWSNEAGPLP